MTNLSKTASSGMPEAPPIDIDALKRAGKIYKENAGASIIDIGDRIGLVEFHTKANSINDDVTKMLMVATEESIGTFDALVIGNRGKHFCAGANLLFVLEAARSGNWGGLENTLRAFQAAAMALKYGPLPVVSAPFSSTLGGGCEVCLHSARVAIAEVTYMGLVETSVGLIPGGGGTKELAIRALDHAKSSAVLELQEALQKPFDIITSAKTAHSGVEAKLIFLTDKDTVVATQESAIGFAKQLAIDLARTGHRNISPRVDIPIIGTKGISAFESQINQLRDAKTISDHDAVIALLVATILCGGNASSGTASEQHFLDLEREAFLALVGTKKTQERIEFLLKNNKPLRN